LPFDLSFLKKSDNHLKFGFVVVNWRGNDAKNSKEITMRNLRLCLNGTLAMLALTIVVAGCAATTTSSAPAAAPPDSMENLLTSAGFKIFTPDTPEKLAFVQKLPANKLVPHKRQKDGALRYVYADKANKRIYVGDAAAYQNFINLAVMQKVEERQRQPMELQTDDPEFWLMWKDAHGGG
jgi:hypothetical protein